MSGRLNMLAVGSNPKVLYYVWRLQATGKLSTHIVSEDLTAGTGQITIEDAAQNTEYSFQPDKVLNGFAGLPETKYDVVVVSAKSLQDVSNVSSSLVPFLGKKTIILVESTGYVNLEPFLKNCLPKELHLAVFSVISTVDIRKVSSDNYILKDSQRSITIGESGTMNSKYSTSSQQDLGALAKLLQYQQADGAKVTAKSTYLEFLVEQWKLAIPRICFNPLLILFEQPNPSDLIKQILAKPLLSGLVTELITVAKTMGCKLPVGYDNESNLLKHWIEDNQSRTHDSKLEYLDSPQFFYDFYHKNNLDIDMLLLQPILLADDHGIKTPYLEFLYATICQYQKLNTGPSIFFKRVDDIDVNSLKEENDRLNETLSKQLDEYKALLRENEQLQMATRDVGEKDAKLSQVVSDFENLQVEHQQLQQKHQQKSRQLHQAEIHIQDLQSQAIPVALPAPASAPASAPAQALPPQQPFQSPVHTRVLQQQNVSVDGTPDLRDLTDVAMLGAAMESPIESNAQADAAELSEDKSIPIAPPTQTPPVLQLQKPQDGLSARELELKKKEALLNSREMELNKKWSQMNTQRHPQQLQPPLQPIKQRSQIPQQQQQQPQQQQQQPFGGMPQQPFMNVHAQMNGPSQGAPQPRRVSTMPLMDSDQLYPGINGGGVGGVMNGNHNPQFIKTSRKNRKSSFPIISNGNFGGVDQYSNIRPGNQRHMSLMTGPQQMMIPGSTPTGSQQQKPPPPQQYQQQHPISPQGIHPVSQTTINSGAYSPTIKPNPQFQQQQKYTKSSPDGSSQDINDGSYPTSTSSNSNELNEGNAGNSFSPPTEDLTADTSFGSGNHDGHEPKPLGSIGAPLGAIGGTDDKKKKKKKFGMFGKK